MPVLFIGRLNSQQKCSKLYSLLGYGHALGSSTESVSYTTVVTCWGRWVPHVASPLGAEASVASVQCAI
jgi:hypothetical protein